tara:strand:- start:463 stop:1179 length:717 start_codon:yes stop_codon:yes gene_type:complete
MGMIRDNGELGWGYDICAMPANGPYGKYKGAESIEDLETRLGRTFPRIVSGHYAVIIFNSRSEIWEVRKKKDDQANAIGYNEGWSFLARRPGIYCYTVENNEVYVGQTKDLGKRMKEHYRNPHKIESDSHGFMICRISGTRGDDIFLNPAARMIAEVGLKTAFFQRVKVAGGKNKKSGEPRRDSWELANFRELREIESILVEIVSFINTKPSQFVPFLKKLKIRKFSEPIPIGFIEKF